MEFADRYLEKQNGRFLFEAQNEMARCKLIVVIPCYNEPDLAITLESLFTCNQPKSNVAVLVVINDSEESSYEIQEQNQKTIREIEMLKLATPEWFQLFSIYAQKLPEKHAGAGWARKIGMDWAVSHFNNACNPNGIIISLDADSTVDDNYFQSIEDYFDEHTEYVASTIYFEHPLDESKTNEAIIWYELYMRYYKHAVGFTGFPNSVYTVGSCFAVKAASYVAQGGMNRKKAGEDFYFLHKLMPLGKVGTLNTTTVYPSARLSNRVPFGTGPSLQKFIDGNNDLTMTYPLESFKVMRSFFSNIDSYYQGGTNLGVSLLSENSTFQLFCNEDDVPKKLEELIRNCSSIEVFRKRFFHMFNAFFILKWLNFEQLSGTRKEELLTQSQLLIQQMGVELKNIPVDPKLMLKLYRSIDKAERNV